MILESHAFCFIDFAVGNGFGILTLQAHPWFISILKLTPFAVDTLLESGLSVL